MSNIFFVTTDISMGLGMASWLKETWIITIQYSKLTDRLRSQGYNVWCLDELSQLDVKTTGHLLAHSSVQKFISEQSKNEVPHIIVFKNSHKIEQICISKDYRLIANPVDLSSQIEDKFNLSAYVPDEYLVPHFIKKPSEIKLSTNWEKLVIQTNRGWAGNSTYIFDKHADALNYLNEIEDRPLKVSQFIEGPTFTLNACITSDSVISSRLAWQINRPNEYWATKSATTCGRQWDDSISDLLNSQANLITQKVGENLVKTGYRGYFGLDLMESNGALLVIEINPRLTASESFYTRLEIESGAKPLVANHFESLLNISSSAFKKSPLVKGCQLVVRNNRHLPVKVNSSIAHDLNYSNNKLTPLDTWGQSSLKIWSTIGSIESNSEILKLESRIPLAVQNQVSPQLSSELINLRDSLIN